MDLGCELDGLINSKDPPAKQAAEKAQNDAKNNFCLKGNPISIDFDVLKNLQDTVKQKHVVFGRQEGPTPDRSVLKSLIKNANGTLGEGQLVQLIAFVFQARQENAESVNCEQKDLPLKNDIHISLSPTHFSKPVKGSPPNDPSRLNECFSAVAEMSPHFRPASWTPENVNLVADRALPVRVTGHLLFDSSHSPCDVSGPKPVSGGEGNPLRFTLWEVHPIYAFEVCASTDINQCKDPNKAKWMPIEQWVQKNGSGSPGKSGHRGKAGSAPKGSGT